MNSQNQVELSTEAWKTLLLDAYGRQGIEACGALLGKIDDEGNWLIEEAYPLRNTYGSAVYFEFAPEDLLTLDLEQHGRMIGVYHSHPSGPAIASSTDRQNMQRVNVEQQIPWVWLIVSGPFHSGPESSITANGLIAYYHAQETGLQQIAIRQGN